ncbi:TraR/DksA C4-type zinc finger protein [Paracoccus sp. (in: a-proteobacteria)]|uniref:TraR/DksA family transcriptional regulator n=1 Tax=Paracoccus sp. TaxID=267 RepID=UPI0028A95465|nr:TraR/DksA C4-type zinc finger protein [Paracoccus sp. (in: a-proteobacteria)]
MDLHARKAMLRTRRNALLADLASIRAVLDGSVPEKGAQAALQALGSVQQAEAGRIEAALQRIESGEYGLCTECGGSIQPDRLDLLPETLFCADCAAQAWGAGATYPPELPGFPG